MQLWHEKWKFWSFLKVYSATYLMRGNFARINNMLSKRKSQWLYMICMLKHGWKLTKLKISQKPLLKIFFTVWVLFDNALDHSNPYKKKTQSNVEAHPKCRCDNGEWSRVWNPYSCQFWFNNRSFYLPTFRHNIS